MSKSILMVELKDGSVINFNGLEASLIAQMVNTFMEELESGKANTFQLRKRDDPSLLIQIPVWQIKNIYLLRSFKLEMDVERIWGVTELDKGGN